MKLRILDEHSFLIATRNILDGIQILDGIYCLKHFKLHSTVHLFAFFLLCVNLVPCAFVWKYISYTDSRMQQASLCQLK